MEGGIYTCPLWWTPWLPAGARPIRTARGAAGRRWDVLALTPAGCRRLRGRAVSCGVLLLPGDCPPDWFPGVRHAVAYGLSPRDSLTFSSLREPVLCVQRELPRPDGGVVEPQEIPFRRLPGPAERLLPLLGLRLLLIPPANPGPLD